ncbi:MAG: dienelactone hydrolase family protein [Pseudomonas sp.]
MKKTLSTLMVLAGSAGLAQADMVTRTVDYQIDGETYQGMLVYDDATAEPRPGLLMVPNWMGVTENAAKKAYRAAGTDYVVFVTDMYGKNVRPADAAEAGAVAGAVKNDRALMRNRVNAALEVFKAEAGERLDVGRLGAIGFCFGGTTVLELARSGTQIGGVVSFHGNLDTPDNSEADAIKMPILVLHGADDPYVPPEQVAAFENEMRQAQVADWQLISYGGAVHSFTDPTANSPGQAQYDERVANRAFDQMRLFFNETLGVGTISSQPRQNKP